MDESPTRLQPPLLEMTNKKLVFLSGLPRTGSTLITAILKQNPQIHTGPTSPLARLLFSVHSAGEGLLYESLVRSKREDFIERLSMEIPKMFYEDVDKPVIVDKDRAWGHDEFNLIRFCSLEPRILMMLRPITEITKSFVDFRTRRGDLLPSLNVMTLNGPYHTSIITTANALRNVSERYLFGTYDQLTNDPHAFFEQVYSFWGLTNYRHDFANIPPADEETEKQFGTQGLHEVRPKLEKRDYQTNIASGLWEYSKELDEALWHDYEQAKKIRPESFIV